MKHSDPERKPQPRRELIAIRVSAEERENLRRKAERMGIPVSALVRLRLDGDIRRAA